MLRRHQQFYYQVLQLVDAFLLAGALWLAHILRTHATGPHFPEIGPIGNYLWLLGIILPAGPLLLEFQGFYQITFPQNGWATLARVVRGILYLWLLLLGVIVFLKIPGESISRAVLVLFVPIAVAAMMVRDGLFRAWFRHKGGTEGARRNVLLCGSLDQRRFWKEMFLRMPNRQFMVRAEADLRTGFDDAFVALLHDQNIEVAVFELDHTLFAPISQAIKACEAEGIEAWVTADFLNTALAQPRFDEFWGRPLLVFRTSPDASWQLLAKSLFDRVGAMGLLLVLSPVLLLVALAVYVSSGRPVFFSQMRSGRHGKPFRMYKFRTMVTEAEQRQAELRAFNQMSGPVFKMDKDPRITPLGAWLRRSSLDEFPQLWNVAKGEMSLVGPRPLPVNETERFTDYAHRRRLSVKPGLTCLWQVAGRNNITDFSDWVRLDLEYIDNWSLLADFRILLRTIPVLLFGKGAR